jgi:spore maturation protein CgeB
VNAAHDEEGVTHKPFQIACCRRALVHHEISELDRLFTPGSECLLFRDGPSLLEHVRSCADESRGATIAERALDRCSRDHGWDARLRALLRL